MKLRTVTKISLAGALVLIIAAAVAPIFLNQVAATGRSYDWKNASPESQGLDPEKLSSLQADLTIRDTTAFLIIRNNRIVHEWYASENENRFRKSLGLAFEEMKDRKFINAGKDILRPIVRPSSPKYERYNLGAIAKSLQMGMALMVAVDHGYMDLDDPVWKYIPAWKDDPERSKITIRHLATQTSGIENVRFPYETEGWKGVFSRDTQARFSLANSKASVTAEPGTHYVYSSTGFYSLAYAIGASLKNTDEPDMSKFLQKNIMTPLGIPEGDWVISYGGQTYDVEGMELYAPAGAYTARAVAKLGELLLRQGNWEGEQLISPQLIEAMTSYAATPDLIRPPDTPGTTIGGWTNFDALWPEVPEDAFISVGANHKVLLVVPSLDLIVVRFGGSLKGEGLWTEEGGPYFEALEEYLLNPLMATVLDIPEN